MKNHLVFLLASALISCQPKPVSVPDASQLLAVDRDFSRLSMAKGMNHAFASYIAQDGTILRNNSRPIVGKDKVIERLQKNSDTTFRLTWEPMHADLAKSGELGYTYGTYLVSSLKGDSLGVGTYVSIWKKDKKGEWKFVFDAGNEGL